MRAPKDRAGTVSTNGSTAAQPTAGIIPGALALGLLDLLLTGP